MMDVVGLVGLCCNSLENPIGIETLGVESSQQNRNPLQLIGKPDRD